jgi:hypothetical protein
MTIPQKPTLPSVLFRYCPATLQTVANIKEQCLFFGGVDSFNDPFECALLSVDAKADPGALRLLREHYADLQAIPESVRSAVREMEDEAFAAMMTKTAKESVSIAKRNFIERRGVVCFSERNENLLMWSHYASGGAGLCLEFDTAHEMFRSAFKVQYSEKPLQLDALSVVTSSICTKTAFWIEEMYCTKPSDWSYEREWRVIHQIRGTKFTYPQQMLKSVYFGPRCALPFIEVVCLTLQGQNPSVQFWRGSMSRDAYAVVFEPFDYVPFVREKE